MTDFSKFEIKDYKHWGVFVHENQGYLGRCIVWCKRDDAVDLTDATEPEIEELFLILKDLRVATKKAFNADWMNYAFLGNETRHLHAHVIPRYSSEREFFGITFEDKLWGHNYRTNRDLKFSPETIESVRVALKEALSSNS